MFKDEWELERFFSGIDPEYLMRFVNHSKQMSKAITSHEEYEKEHKNIRFEFCKDFSATVRWGETYVYAYANKNGDIFYVGQGGLQRMVQFYASGRTKDFAEIANNDIHLFVIAKRTSKENALSIEKVLIQYAQLRDFPIINKQETLDTQEYKYFRYRLSGGDVINKTHEWKYRQYCNLLKEHEGVIARFSRLCDACEKGDIAKQKRFEKPEYTKPPLLTWTIDGIEKPRAEWCRIYGRNRATVEARMRQGLTVKQALTFPNAIADGKHGCAIDQWKEMGLL